MIKKTILEIIFLISSIDHIIDYIIDHITEKNVF